MEKNYHIKKIMKKKLPFLYIIQETFLINQGVSQFCFCPINMAANNCIFWVKLSVITVR